MQFFAVFSFLLLLPSVLFYPSSFLFLLVPLLHKEAFLKWLMILIVGSHFKMKHLKLKTKTNVFCTGVRLVNFWVDFTLG